MIDMDKIITCSKCKMTGTIVSGKYWNSCFYCGAVINEEIRHN